MLWGIQLRAVSQGLYLNLIRNICPGIRLPKWLHFLWFSELSIDLVLSSCELVCIISVYEVANKFKRPNNYDNSSMKSWIDLPGTEYVCAVVFTAAYPLWTVMNVHFDYDEMGQWPGQNGRHFTNNIFWWIFLKTHVCFLSEFRASFLPIDNNHHKFR